MTTIFFILALFTVAGTLAAMCLRSPIHCVLAATISFAGFSGLYLHLGAQFVGLTQILVYVGAVAILSVFALMMTSSRNRPPSQATLSDRLSGIVTGAGVFAVLAWAIHSARLSPVPPQAEAAGSVQQIGEALMHRFVLPLEIVGVLLTAALIGAVVVAMDPGDRLESK
jgi:NADH-quinone oxidoreductase subunit J